MKKMNFTTYSKNNSNSDVYSQSNANNNNNSLLTFNNVGYLRQSRILQQKGSQPNNDTISSEPQPKKMKWGEPTWLFFHTIAYKIKDEKFQELESKYSTSVTKNIIFNFIIHYQDKHKSIHMIANDMYRSRQVVYLKEWFNNNFKYFDP